MSLNSGGKLDFVEKHTKWRKIEKLQLQNFVQILGYGPSK
jgi:hypothetical protein